MKKINDRVYLSIGQVAYKVRRSNQTIKNWYRWAQQSGISNEEAGLPEYRVDLDGRGTYYFDEEDVPKLELFKEAITYGKMSEYNVTRWGSRGKDIEARKQALEEAEKPADEPVE